LIAVLPLKSFFDDLSAAVSSKAKTFILPH
jgi:hypothetical protein